MTFVLCLLLSLSVQDGFEDLERLRSRLEKEIKRLKHEQEEEPTDERRHELKALYEKLDHVKREMMQIKEERKHRRMRIQELEELIHEIHQALKKDLPPEERRAFEEDLHRAERELSRLHGPRDDRDRHIEELKRALEHEKNPKRRHKLELKLKELFEKQDRPPRMLEAIEKFPFLDEETREWLRELHKEGRLEEIEKFRFKMEKKFRDGPPNPFREDEHEVEKFARRLREAAGEERDRLVEKLRAMLSELFDKKEDHRRREVEDLARRVRELMDQLERRAENRDRIIEKRLRELLGDREKEHDREERPRRREEH